MKDPNLSRCSEASRGIWIDLLCAMHEAGRCGLLSGTVTELSRMCRSTPAVLALAITELSTYGAAVVSDRDGVITITNRRMQREFNERQMTRKRVENYRVRKKTRQCNAPSSSSCSISSESDNLTVALSPPPRIGQTAPKDRKGARNTSERESKSRFSLKECEQYAASLKGIKQPKAYGKTIWRSAEADDEIAEFLGHSGKPMKKQPDRPVDVAEMQRLADEFEAMDPPRKDLADALRAGIEASK